MITDLRNSIIFLHGLSGSGKGEIQRKLSEHYSTHGYETVYISSGALFRAALSNPVIAEQVRRGYFLDTLGAVMPGIENTLEHFVKRWIKSEGRAVVIVDGVIRRGAFINKDGVAIPSQIEQVSLGMHNVIKNLVTEDKDLVKLFPEYAFYTEENEGKFVYGVKQMLQDATHIVADVLPNDAETQMKRRADKEIASIRKQLQDRFTEGKLSVDRIQETEKYIYKLEAILHGGVKRRGDGLIYIPRIDWSDRTNGDLHQLLAVEVKQIRESMAQSVGKESSAPLTASLESMGIFTELRDDDISPVGRKTRIENYIKMEVEKDKHLFDAGFATQALCADLGFKFNHDGSFSSEAKNCIVITNGQSRGIGLEQFQAKCEQMANRLYRETEYKREIMSRRKEGQSISREREF